MKYMNTLSYRSHERGQVSPTLIMLFVMIFLFVIAGSLAIWAYVSYDKEKSNVDIRISEAVTKAQKDQAEADEKKFAEREKEPLRQFAGPIDYGRVTFSYPKTWSVYESRDTTAGGRYDAYLHPLVVPPVAGEQRFALRVTVESVSYDQVLKQYESLIKKGDLKSSPVSANGNSGTRVEGNFTKDLKGIAVIFKIRDKTLTVRTDLPTFFPDYEVLVPTINFNQ